jgi:hypothetical protein
LDLTVVFVRPEMGSVIGVDQLRRNPEMTARSAYTSLKDITHVQLLGDLPYVQNPVLVDKAGVARDHSEGFEAAQRSGDVLDDAVCEVVLLRITAKVLERQNRE